jgi:nucleotide-binding universal stress UspA family protein
MSQALKRYGVVVGVDGSVASNFAVRWAAHETSMRHVPLTLVQMVKTVPTAYPEMSLSADAAGGTTRAAGSSTRPLRIAEGATRASGKIVISREMRCSPTVPTLIEMSAEAETVVVGCHGRGAIGRLFLGSVSSGAVHSAKCPVAVVRDEDPLMPDPLQAPVLVGIDCSPASELAVAVAFDEASHRGDDLKALKASSDVDVRQIPRLGWRSEAERSLAEYLAGWQERCADVKVHRVVVLDHPGQALIDESESAQLVVVGSRAPA